MSFLQLFEDVKQQEEIEIPEGWLQGRTVFGGLVAGLLMQKACSNIQDPDKRLLSCSVTFVGPVQQGTARLTIEILREGKSVTTLEARLWQDGAVQTILVASFGVSRTSNIEVKQEPVVPLYAQPENLKTIPFSKHMPECFQHFDVCWAEGNYPVTASEQPDFGGWSRFSSRQYENRQMTVPDLVVLMDIWPPGVLPMFKQIAPASSLTWHITYVRPIQHQLYDWFKYKVVTEYAGEGYSTEYAYLWDQNDHLIAILRQTVTVFT
ncbi:thioesterase family protein [Acinetobacter sp.]|jgi:acyl-CoA thioesterase|uniref:thioesterase family protein n=1 Tax=Acinetobacter sp. TaxID=472 RepID=UPI00281ED04F|nr:thioesterase family protein [Acinetobacter sp.]MDR2248789.1 thioesterase family protein [Acinetobacter sp.]